MTERLCEAALRMSGDGRAVVLLVGAPGLPETAWDEMTSILRRDVSVIGVVHPGHAGRPSPDSASAAIERCADDLVQVLTRAGHERAHVLAWCLGTRLALAFADRYADRVLSLVLLAPALSMRAEDTRHDPLHRALTSLYRVAQSRRARLPVLVRLISPPGTPTSLADLPEQTLFSYLELYHSWQKYDTTAPLERLRVPTILIAGERDDVVPVEWLRRWQSERLPSAQLRVIADAGHLAFRERPADVAAQVLDALQTRKEAAP